MLPLLVFMALVWVLKNAAEDVMHASKGQTSPRQKYRQERWAARNRRTGTRPGTTRAGTPRGAARQYLADLWADSWADANTNRADRVADRRAAYEAAREAEQRERERLAQPAPTTPTPRPVNPATATTPTPTPTSDPTPIPGAATDPATATDEPEPAATSEPTRPLDLPIPTADQLKEMFEWPAFDPADSTEPATTSTTSTEDTMTSPEVAGHDSAKAYAATMATKAGQAVTSLEQTIATMAAKKVGAPALGHLGRAQEAATQMQTELNAALTVLNRHNPIQEGYAANPDAGDKDWMQPE